MSNSTKIEKSFIYLSKVSSCAFDKYIFGIYCYFGMISYNKHKTVMTKQSDLEM